MMTKPILNYFSICGRGELARLIAAAGEVEIIDKTWAPAFGEDGNWRPGYKAIGEARGFPGTMPILEQGDFAIFQVRKNVAAIAIAIVLIFARILSHRLLLLLSDHLHILRLVLLIVYTTVQ